MKKSILLGFILFSTLSCKAQIIPIESKKNYIGTGISLPDNVTYIKDVNNILDRYVGIWKGDYDGKNYQLIITKYINTYNGIMEDCLLMRYLITGVNGAIIEDTRILSDNSPYVVESRYLQNITFVLI